MKNPRFPRAERSPVERSSITRCNERTLKDAGYTLVEITIIRVAHLVISHARIIEYRFLVAMLASLSLSLFLSLGSAWQLTRNLFACRPTRLSTSIPLSVRKPWATGEICVASW